MRYETFLTYNSTFLFCYFLLYKKSRTLGNSQILLSASGEVWQNWETYVVRETTIPITLANDLVKWRNFLDLYFGSQEDSKSSLYFRPRVAVQSVCNSPLYWFAFQDCFNDQISWVPATTPISTILHLLGDVIRRNSPSNPGKQEQSKKPQPEVQYHLG